MAQLEVFIYDGTRQLFAAPADFLITIIDGNQTQHYRNYCTTNTTIFEVPLFGNSGDEYRVIVWAKGFQQAGFVPVVVSEDSITTINVMLIAEDPGFSFVNARWNNAFAKYPFLGGDIDEVTAEARYETLLDQHEKALACLLNLSEAMSLIPLGRQTPLDYLKQIRWDDPEYMPAQDRFFAWCDATLIDQVKAAADAGQFDEEKNPGVFHPGATRSWKQIQFGEANVQLTFHEGETRTIDGVDCVMVEPDIDYYKDLAAHAIFEVAVNGLTNSLTEPAQVYVLRWMDGNKIGIPDFAPIYTITA